MPGRHAPNQEHLLQQGQPAFDRLAVHAESAGQGGQIERLARDDGGVLEQPGQFRGFRDLGDLDHIACCERAGIGREPDPAARGRGPRQRLRVAAGHDAGDQIRGPPGRFKHGEIAREGALKKSGSRMPVDLRLAEGQ